MKKALILFSLIGFIYACGNQSSTESTGSDASTTTNNDNVYPSYDPERGAGKFTNVEV